MLPRYLCIDRGTPGDRLCVLRFGVDGSPDTSFGGRVKRRSGRDVSLDPGVYDAFVDASGRLPVCRGARC